MGKKIQKGKKGESCKYITRAKAIRKLQVTLKDFRRLCILKGIFPREPPKKLVKRNTTYYHMKDVNFLEHDRILQKFRDIKSHLKKIKKAQVKNQALKEKKLKSNMPKYTLNHLVKERYPSFTDALRDLDDPLCLVNLFSAFHTHKDLGVPREKIQNCMKLAREFNLFVIKSKSLRKAFLSIKGIYYQAEIQGQQITWIAPYQLPANLPMDVDYRVMLTFQEFYETLLKFVNYKLFNSMNVKYPLETESSIEENNHFCYKAFVLKNTEGNLFDEDNEKYQIDEKFQKEMQDKAEELNQFQAKDLFKDLVFFLSSEVPRYSLEFVILSLGGQVYWAGDESGVKFDDKKITHFVTDRKPEHLNILKNREYIQPQWVYDSLNNAVLLPIGEYSPGKILPPHLSPFNTNNLNTYKPQREKEISQLKGEKVEEEEDEDDDEEIQKMLQEEQEAGSSDEQLEENEKIDGEEEEDEEEEENDEEIDEEEEEDDDEEEDDEEDDDSSSEDDLNQEEENLSSEVVDEVEGEGSEEENEYDHEKVEQKKLTKEQQKQLENRELAKGMMSKKNKTLYKLMQHKKEKAEKEAFKLKAKALRIKRKEEFLNKRKNQPKPK